MTSTNKRSIAYGKNDVLSDDDFKNCKVRISMWVDEDVLDAYKAEAARRGKKYQTFMHEELRHAVQLFGKTPEEYVEQLSPEEIRLIRALLNDRDTKALLSKLARHAKERVIA